MGRESRRQRDPDDLNRGDAGRIVMAHGKCVQLLASDLRVQEHYRAWALAQDRLDRIGVPPGAPARAATAIDILAAALRPMGVPWRWAAEHLIAIWFPAMLYNERRPPGTPPQIVRVSAGIVGLPAGRAPRHHGQDVHEWVTWWYRRTVKQPTDSVYALAQEYAIREKRHPRADSVVDDGIKRAESLLNSVVPRPAAS